MSKARKAWYSIAAMASAISVYIYDEIGSWGVTAQDFIDQLRDEADSDLDVHINSPGGSVFDGLAIYNALKAHAGRVDVYIDGVAASMASIIALAGDQVAMAPNALMMIHNPASGTFGDAGDLRKQADLLDKVKSQLVAIYMTRANVDEAQIVRMMDEETWLTAEEALALGLIDVILDEPEVDVAACARDFRLEERFGALPDKFPAGSASATPSTPATAGIDPAPAGRTPTAPGAVNPKESSIMETKTDPAAVRNAVDEARRLERERRDGIKALFEPHFGHAGMKDCMTTCILEDVDVDAAKDRLIAKLATVTGTPDAEPAGGRAVVTEDARTKFVAGAERALLVRAGLEKATRDDDRNEFRGSHLVDLARHSVEVLGGRSVAGWDRMKIVAEAFSHGTDDFDSVLANVAFKALLMGYEETEEVYPNLVRIVPMQDFKTAKLAGLSAFSDLDEVGEHGEYKHGSMEDVGENAQLTTYGKLFRISRQAIINDDLMAFTETPRQMGRAGRRKIGDIVADLLAGAGHVLDQDSKALFHADHNNTGSAAPSTAGFEDARTKMAKQTDPSSNAFLNIMPTIAYVPHALLSSTQQVNVSETEIAASQNNSRRPNTARGLASGGVFPDARLDAEDAAAWYMLGNPATHPSLVLGLLNGQDAPYLEEETGFTRDGVSFKVRIDAVAEAVDFRSIYRGNNT